MTSQGANWFARQMGAQNPAPRVPPLPSVSPPATSVPVLTYSQAPQPVQAQRLQITGQENYQQMVNAIEQQTGEHPTLLKMSRHWKGGEAMRTEGHLTCPKCGSMNIFTRSNVKVMNENGTMGHAKPRCFDCGWQESYTPGDPGNWGT